MVKTTDVTGKKKETLEEKQESRKKIVRDTFLKIVVKHNKDTKFDYNRYICGTGGKGLLCDALGEHNPYDRALFQQVLRELLDEEKLINIGGAMYDLK